VGTISADQNPLSQLQAPPAQPVRLIFIHHSTGGNWLADPNADQPAGGLARALMENNYYVSATNYGWGPDGIGDRTDIVNWPEWFTGPQHEAIMQAVYEESNQNIGGFGDWPRLSQNPGGENQIIIFKSCFPNSDLWGSPDDLPQSQPNDEYTVANAKAVYNAILAYFETRQDKLFVVITAPPLAEGEYYDDALSGDQRAANARAFNDWLVNDWLADYPHNNVVVFDYYNVLTSNGSSSRVDDRGSNQEPNDSGWEDGNHHRWWNGAVQHIQTVNNNFSSYPTSSDGDSHPTSQGQQKATDEFVTLLNVYYNLWQAGQPQPPPVVSTVDSSSGDRTDQPLTSETVGLIDDMETQNAWSSSPDDLGSSVESVLADQEAHGGSQSLRIEIDIAEGGWGDTGRYFETSQDWSAADGVEFWLHTSQANVPFSLILFSGSSDSPTPFEINLVTSPESTSGWVQYAIGWNEFTRADWADPSGLEDLDPVRINGLSLNYFPGQAILWLDDVSLFGEDQISQEAQTDLAEPEQPGGICPLGFIMPGFLLGWAWLFERTK
jgi:hypothetical protein